MSENFDRYTDLFLDEASEQIEELNQNLLILEREGYDPEIINEIFRTAHTLKSSAAFVGLEDLSDLAHKMEDLLQKVKDEKVTVSTDLVNIFFQCLDRIKAAVGQVSEGKMPDDTFSDLIESLIEYSEKNTEGTQAVPAAAVPSPEPRVAPEPGPAEEGKKAVVPQAKEAVVPSRESVRPAPPVTREAGTSPLRLSPADEKELSDVAGGKKVFDGIVKMDPEAPMKNMRLLLLSEHLKKVGVLFRTDPPVSDFESEKEIDTFRFIYYGDKSREELSKTCQVDSVDEVRILDHGTRSKAVGPAGGARRREAGEETHVKTKNIKVSSEKIDYLLNSVGELVITNSGLLKIYEDLSDEFGDAGMLGELKTKIDQAARIARDLQSGIMKTRMIPVDLVFQRFTRPVRDLALELGKDVDLKFQGEDTELDKNIIDALNDPLLHLVRNSLDHGIEPPEEREAAGKEGTAKLLLNAFQSGNNIYVEVRDDGRGLNRDKILKRAAERNLIPEDAMLSDDEIYNLIFHPGFSTAEAVTDVSGRGVGMNVVKKMVQEFKGNIQIHNEPGQGCAFILSFPLTLAIISSILVKVEEEEFAFPLSDVVETIKVDRDDITTLQGKDIINLRGDILPIFQLGSLMGFPEKGPDPEFPVVIANVNNRKIGFIVDTMVGKQEIVIKSLEQNFRTVKGLIGACLMGDGSIVMVLDVQGLLDIAQNEELTKMLPGASRTEILDAIKEYNKQVLELSGVLRRQARSRKALKKKERDEREYEEEPEDSEISAMIRSRDESAAMTAAAGVTESVSAAQPVTATATIERPSVSAEGYVETPLHPSLVTAAREGGEERADDDRVRDALTGFEAEKKERIRRAQTILSGGEEEKESKAPEAAETDAALHADDEISDDDFAKLYAVINTGMINAGFVLSQLLGVTVEVSVPEFKTISLKSLGEYIPGDRAIFVALDTHGDFHALIVLAFDEENGSKASADLMGQSLSKVPPEEEVQSVLSELTNIVGSSILNAMANKSGLSITPSVPSYSRGTADEFVKGLESENRVTKDTRAIYISADFFREDMELIGRVFLLPSRPTLGQLIRRL